MAGGGIDEIELLLREHEHVAQEQRSFNALLVTGLGIGIALMGAIGSVLVQTCSADDFQRRADELQLRADELQQCPVSVVDPDCSVLDDRVLVLLPLVVVMLITFLLVHGLQATIRARYLRSIEYSIREHANASPSALTPYGIGHLLHPLDGGKPISLGFRLVLQLQWVPAGIIGIGVVVLSIGLIDDGNVQLAAALGYGALALLLFGTQLRNIAGLGRAETMWSELRKRMEGELGRTGDGFPRSKGVRWTYVALPRPVDLLKSLLHLVAFVLAARVANEALPLRETIAFVLTIELCVYQARYAANDIRDIETDSSHASADERGRLSNDRAGLNTGILAMAWRVAIFPVALIALPSGPLLRVVIVSVAVVVISGTAYELRKSSSKGTRTKRTTMILLLVGVGYAMRVATGLYLGGLAWSSIAFGAVFGYVLGIMLVAMTWALEGYSHETAGKLGASKQHSAQLIEQVRPACFAEQKSKAERKKVAALLGPLPSRSFLMIATYGALVAAFVLGIDLSREAGGGSRSETIAAVVALVLAVGLTAALRGGNLAFNGFAVFVVGIAGASWRGSSIALAVLPIALAAAVHFHFRRATYASVNPNWKLYKKSAKKSIDDFIAQAGPYFLGRRAFALLLAPDDPQVNVGTSPGDTPPGPEPGSTTATGDSTVDVGAGIHRPTQQTDNSFQTYAKQKKRVLFGVLISAFLALMLARCS